MGENRHNISPPLWFPFTMQETELTLAILGCIATALSLAGVEAPTIIAVLGGIVVVSYLAGLLVYNRRHSKAFSFLPSGALHGEGYIANVRSAAQSLLLMHVDDDSPSEELLLLYRRLLDRGVEFRRILFLRPDSADGSLEWVRRFGSHPKLEHRVVLPEASRMIRWSFVVVDARLVILSVPGGEAIQSESYAKGLLFRDLLVVRDTQVAAVFLEMHRALWNRAEPLDSLSDLEHPEKLAARLRKSAA